MFLVKKFIKYVNRETIDQFSAMNHLNEPEWFDKNWNELEESFIGINLFFDFINTSILPKANKDMLDVAIKHNYPIKGRYHLKIYKELSLKNINHEWFDENWDRLKEEFNCEWTFRRFIFSEIIPKADKNLINVMIENKFIFKETQAFDEPLNTYLIDDNLSLEIFTILVNNIVVDDKLMDELLSAPTHLSFEKFKYMFESGFPAKNYYYVYICDVEMAGVIWEYFENIDKIKIEFSISSGLIKNFELFKNYVEWSSSHGINFDRFALENIARKIGIPGLELLKKKNIPVKIEFRPIGISEDVKKWLIENGSKEYKQISKSNQIFYKDCKK